MARRYVIPFVAAGLIRVHPKRRHGSWGPWRAEIRAQSSLARWLQLLARCRRYLATPFRPFGEPGSGVFKYGKTGK
jgi:hypothetical protein